jgi:hypothetical protein
MLVGLVRLEEVLVAKLFVAEFAVGFRVEYLNAASGTHGRCCAC